LTRILAISGSLRRRSSNTELLRAAALLAPPGVVVTLYEGLERLPHFNPDLLDDEPASVAAWRAQIDAADALLISSPEYARGVAGALKDALDWLVSGSEFVDKPVALLNASPRASHAHTALRTTLTTMSGQYSDDASIALPLLGANLDAAGIATHAEHAPRLRAAMQAFADFIVARRGR
jgi:chromate reductase